MASKLAMGELTNVLVILILHNWWENSVHNVVTFD